MAKLILDSGAYSAWSLGLTVCLDDYIQFCKKHPEISYYVNLDVIAGDATSTRAPRREEAEEACQESWKNYQKMLKHLPIEKVIPVFHQVDPIKWLERYLSFGTPYLGISPRQKYALSVRFRWLKSVVGPRLASVDYPIKTHGFGFTSASMLGLGWTSVDSAKWVRMAGYGGMILPKRTRGVWDFTKTPWQVATTDRPIEEGGNGLFPTEKLGRFARTRFPHYDSLSPRQSKDFFDYLSLHKMPLGEWDVMRVPKDYKVDRGSGDRKTKDGRVIKVRKNGVVTSHMCRKWMNLQFMLGLAEVVPVENMYLAGMVGLFSKRFETVMENRLLSFADYVKGGKRERLTFAFHLHRLKEQVDAGAI